MCVDGATQDGLIAEWLKEDLGGCHRVRHFNWVSRRCPRRNGRCALRQ